MAAPGVVRFLKPLKIGPAEKATEVIEPVVVRLRNQTTTQRTAVTIVKPRQ